MRANGTHIAGLQGGFEAGGVAVRFWQKQFVLLDERAGLFWEVLVERRNLDQQRKPGRNSWGLVVQRGTIVPDRRAGGIVVQRPGIVLSPNEGGFSSSSFVRGEDEGRFFFVRNERRREEEAWFTFAGRWDHVAHAAGAGGRRCSGPPSQQQRASA